MKMTRRKFLGHVAASPLIPVAADLSRRSGEAAKAEHKIERLGLQLYTVRDQIAKDFEGTLAKVAAAGYKEVEFAGYFDHAPKDVRAILDRHKLAAPSTHVDFASVETKLAQVIESSHAIGHKFIVNPWLDEEMRKQPDVWKRVAATFNKAGEACKKAGIQFAYHNHHFEFVPVNGVMPFDQLLKDCDAGLVKMELDLVLDHGGPPGSARVLSALPWQVPAGARQRPEEDSRGPGSGTVRSGDSKHHGRRDGRHRRLEADFRKGRSGGNPPLLRGARRRPIAVGQHQRQRQVPERVAFLVGSYCTFCS